MSTRYPLVRLTSEPTEGAVIRFDFNADLTWAEHDGFTVGSPAFVGDPDGIGVEYSLRPVAFNLILQGEERQALRQQGELARELLRPDNYLMIQVSPTAAPRWLKVYRSSPGAVSLDQVKKPFSPERDNPGSWWAIAVSLMGDPFFLGEKETRQVTVTPDPATGGKWTLVTNVKGDAPAPVNVEMAATAVEVTTFAPLISVTALDLAPGEAWTTPVRSVTAGVDGSIAAVPSASGGSAVQVGFASPGMAVRAYANFDPPFAGRWRLFARVQLANASVPATVVTIRPGGDAQIKASADTVLNNALGWRMIDLGVYAFPKGNMPNERPYALAPAQPGDVQIHAQRTAGNQPLQIDYVYGVPVDLPVESVHPTTLLTVEQMAPAADSYTFGTVKIDSESGRVHRIDDQGELRRADSIRAEGAYPNLVPGATNVLTFWLGEDQNGFAGDSIAASKASVLTLTYRPRYLYLGGY